MTYAAKVSKAIYAVERILAIILFAAMVTCILLGVAFRYFLHSPLNWTDEYALYALVWITFIGGSMSIHQKKAAMVSFVMERIPRYLSKPLVALGTLLTLAFTIYLLYLSVQWISDPLVFKQRSATGLSMFFPYIVIPLSFGFMSIHLIPILIGMLRSDGSEENA
jgi:TRAP-type C4-dicarboxylate transport system permease small subunit